MKLCFCCNYSCLHCYVPIQYWAWACYIVGSVLNLNQGTVSRQRGSLYWWTWSRNKWWEWRKDCV